MPEHNRTELPEEKKRIKQFTASGVIVTPDRKKTLLIFHKKLQSWLQPGGHTDPNEFPCDAARREVFEEVGLQPRLISQGEAIGIKPSEIERQIPHPLGIFAQQIPKRVKVIDGVEEVEEAHIHIDMMYLMEHEEALPKISERELAEARWFTREEVSKHPNIFPGTRQILLKFLV